MELLNQVHETLSPILQDEMGVPKARHAFIDATLVLSTTLEQTPSHLRKGHMEGKNSSPQKISRCLDLLRKFIQRCEGENLEGHTRSTRQYDVILNIQIDQEVGAFSVCGIV